MDLERVDAARVVGGGVPQEEADHTGQDEAHKCHPQCAQATQALARRLVWVFRDRKLGTLPAVGQVGRLGRGVLPRSVVRRVVHVLSSVSD